MCPSDKHRIAKLREALTLQMSPFPIHGYMDAGSADPLARGRGFKVRKPASAHGPIEPAHCWPYHVDGSGVKKERAVIEQQLYPLVFG